MYSVVFRAWGAGLKTMMMHKHSGGGALDYKVIPTVYPETFKFAFSALKYSPYLEALLT